ncbi:MAG: pyruvate kinase [Deltaproteobacteria bacterium]|nr:pyruvate kinase [Deltaproteobacteria bacterium]
MSTIVNRLSVPKPRRTKIIATVGPASRSPEKIKSLIDAGANVFRLNFSHGSHGEHLETLKTIRRVSDECGAYSAILQDLSGPKIRITNVAGDTTQIPDGGTIQLKPAKTPDKKDELSDSKCIYVEGVDPTKILQVGHNILLADGIIMLNVDEIKEDFVECRVIKGGKLRSRVGIAFPDSAIDLPAATDKDLVDLAWGIKNEVDYVALSFVQNAQDIKAIRDVIHRESGNVRIIAKIERKSALQNSFEILDSADGIMVARGDLGLELPLEQLPMIQKQLIEEGNYRGIPVIVATQMLHSMITSVRPTRAEVTDISAAVMGGADALMLSEETAIGEHPVASVEYLSRIARESEKSFEFQEYKLRLRDADQQSVPDAVSYAACAAAVKIKAAAIIVCTETGNSARLVAKYRPQQPLFAVSSNMRTLRRMSLCWGVIPIYSASSVDHYNETEAALKALQSQDFLPVGSRAVITGGLAVNVPGATSILEIREIR